MPPGRASAVSCSCHAGEKTKRTTAPGWCLRSSSRAPNPAGDSSVTHQRGPSTQASGGADGGGLGVGAGKGSCEHETRSGVGASPFPLKRRGPESPRSVKAARCEAPSAPVPRKEARSSVDDTATGRSKCRWSIAPSCQRSNETSAVKVAPCCSTE
eukprot:scaffold2104_cov120-Isochrysis_galbana.AAC.4